MLKLLLVALLLTSSSLGNNVTPDLQTGVIKITTLNDAVNQLQTALQRAMTELESSPQASLAELTLFVAKVLEFQKQAIDFRKQLSVIKGTLSNDQSIYDLPMAKLTRAITEVESFLNRLKLKHEDMEAKRLPIEAANAVLNGDFNKANAVIDQINDDASIRNIVHNVHGSDASKVPLLLAFAESLSDKERAYQVFQALGDELKNNNHDNTNNLINVINSLKSTIVDNVNAPADTKSRAQVLLANLRNRLKTQALKELKASVHSKGYDYKLADKIYNFDISLYDTLIKPIFEDLLKLQGGKMTPMTMNPQAMDKGILDVKIMNDVLRNTNQMNKNAIQMAFNLKEMASMPTLTRNQRDALNGWKNQLPAPANLIASGNNVCIFNKAYGEYLFADEKYKRDASQRYVFTWQPKDNVGGRFWKIQKRSPYFTVTNLNNNEDMMAGNPFDTYRRYVYTKQDSTNEGDWDIEVEGNYVQFRNYKTGEYLYAAESNYNFCSLRRRVFLWHSGKHPQSFWRVDNC